ncbi:MAG: hypothetical protein KGN02_00850 [bacterium]|nr:hypothetical protein [bacterium]
MDSTISAEQLGRFFATAPLVLGVVIYAIAFIAKRNEGMETAPSLGTTYACAQCGKRSVREHMVPQAHAGAVSYYCAKCAGAH